MKHLIGSRIDNRFARKKGINIANKTRVRQRRNICSAIKPLTDVFRPTKKKLKIIIKRKDRFV